MEWKILDQNCFSRIGQWFEYIHKSLGRRNTFTAAGSARRRYGERESDVLT